MLIGDDYVLSPKDLCTIEFIDQLIEAGIDSFKIERRKRAPEYVAKTVSVYRKAINLYYKKKLTSEKKKEFLKELETVYNRGFSTGFYFGKPSSEDYAGVEGSKAITRKVYVGKVLNYFKKPKAAHILLESGKLKLNDKILIIGENENTAAIVENDSKISIIGKGAVTIVYGRNITASNVAEITASRAIAISGLQVHVLTPGCIYDIRKRTAYIPPLTLE